MIVLHKTSCKQGLKQLLQAVNNAELSIYYTSVLVSDHKKNKNLQISGEFGVRFLIKVSRFSKMLPKTNLVH